ncbi:hypothetical protein QE422_001091 [Chryseobacterium sp. SORGH_AS 447]|uniref:hypothetical protein n=1 Tax=Chryseobacterium sp. SORGH_AS_0447 TaxID=3041769 RepID=UPI0027881EEF|nr:hypothetical protein [Chryseobacterium sp. SORGH_AS_0447]MDQ1160723.1 hypothetical protein [Chryseobacterium sp. SORGH_AS_0447]
MNCNQKKFEEIKKVLIEKLGDEVEYSKDEDGTEYLAVKNSDFWLSTTFGEWVVGYGLYHTHFSEEFENVDDGIIQAFDLLTNRIKTTKYIKGNTVFKTTVEIEYPDATLVNIGSSGLIFFPFWKKTKLEVKYDEKILEKKEIVDQVNVILEA